MIRVSLASRRILAVLVCGFTCVSISEAQDSVEGLSIAPGVLIDTANSMAYLMTPQRQVKAISLSDGEEIWASSAAAKPISIRGNRIIAQAEPGVTDSVLNLVALDASNGSPVGSSSIDLGSGVIASIDDGREHQFVLGTGDSDSSDGPVLWRFNQQKLSGPEAPQAEVLERFGALDVTQSATMATLDGEGFSRTTGRPPYAQARVSRPVSETPPPDRIILDLDSGQRYRLDGVQVPASSGGTTDDSGATVRPGVALNRAPVGGLITSEGRPGDEFPPTRRISGDQFGYSIDGRYLVASAFGGVIEATEPYRWTVYTRGTFEVVSRFMARTSLAPFVLAEGRVLYLRQPFQQREGGRLQDYPMALVARDASTGQIVWTHAVRDTRYTGMIPEQAR